MLFVAELLAGPRPPGVPRRNLCRNAMSAILVQDLSFGDFEGTVAGSVIVSPAGIRSTTGPVLAGGTVTAAAFDVTNPLSGCDWYPVEITLPATATLTTGTFTMTADSFTSIPATQFTLSPVPGQPTRVYVGARLNSAVNQAGGTYNAPFQVDFLHINP
jgi:hypothetical protein